MACGLPLMMHSTTGYRTVSRIKGFTLIEVMIVVVIVAILAALAVPSYQSHIQEARRTEAKEALTRAAAAQERFFFSNNRYAANLTELGFAANGDGDFMTPEGWYELTLVPSDPITCPNTRCFRINAEPRGGQAADTECSQLTINHTGLTTSVDDSDVATTDECW